MQIKLKNYDWEIYAYFSNNDIEVIQQILKEMSFPFPYQTKLKQANLSYWSETAQMNLKEAASYIKVTVTLSANENVDYQIKVVFQEFLKRFPTLKLTAQSFSEEKKMPYRLQWNKQYVGYELEVHEAKMVPDFTEYQIIGKTNVQ